MPILTSEPNVHPLDLLERLPGGADESADGHETAKPSWWVFYTRSRQEKSLARDLLKRDIAFYLPLVKRRLLVRNRPVHSLVPLFTGYLFMYGTPEQRVRAMMTNRVAQVIDVEDGDQLWADLCAIQRLIENDTPLTVESRLEPNQRVIIRSGALQGLEGNIVRRKNSTRIVVWVKMLQQGVSVEVEDYLLDPLG